MTTLPVSSAVPNRPGSLSLVGSPLRAVAAACWIYAVGMAVAVNFLRSKPAIVDLLTDYVSVPVTVVATLLVGVLLFKRPRIVGAPRRAWWAVAIFAAINLVANEAWIRDPNVPVRALLTFADGLYLGDYWILTAAFILFFVALGGSWRRPRVWLDFATLILVQMIGVWALLVAPEMPSGMDLHASLAVIIVYSFSFAAMTSAAAVLWMQTRSRPGQGPMLLLMAAAWCEVAWEVLWLASWLADTNYAEYYYNFGDLLCFCCVASAAALTRAGVAGVAATAYPERTAESFLPALAALLAIAMVAASMASTRSADAWALVGLVVLCAALVLARQRSAQRELRALSTELAQREADARLTELVRRSADLILVVDAGGATGFVSPASLPMLGLAPESLQGQRGADLLGPQHALPLQRFLEALGQGPTAQAAIELRYETPDGRSRTIRVSGANQLTNPLIKGLVLTLTDVSDQRSLEREVLEVAARERARLCGDIHDGLGQELVGIAMLLQGEATMPDPDPATHESRLKAIVGHVNRSIQIARDLARGLSPLHVVRGSLIGALHRLAHEHTPRKPVGISVEPGVGDCHLDDVAADHLYRIAQEAVLNAVSHAACAHVHISLALEEFRLVMSIDDDGSGFDTVAPDFRGLGLKLMEYRARLVGGTFRVENRPPSGTRVVVTVPVPSPPPVVDRDLRQAPGRDLAAGGS
jgi:PAS domain S-box-containing protein